MDANYNPDMDVALMALSEEMPAAQSAQVSVELTFDAPAATPVPVAEKKEVPKPAASSVSNVKRSIVIGKKINAACPVDPAQRAVCDGCE